MQYKELAKFHCELCGISADIKALEVDHILPRNHGGSDEISNFQPEQIYVFNEEHKLLHILEENEVVKH